MAASIIQCTDVKKSFGKKPVMKGLDLEVPKGSVFGLLGINGAGKTTLIKLLTGLLKPDAGTISLLDDDPLGFTDFTKERFGYVPQKARLYPWLTVAQIVAYTASFYSRWDHVLIEHLIKSWRIDPDERIGNLSEGEAQKVMIVLALGHHPELLILDEPVASLDPGARRQFLKIILELVADRECTVFFSTHITSDLERVADRVALLKDGTVAFCGEMEAVKENVKRIRIIGAGPTPDDLETEHVLGYQRSEHGLLLTVKNYDENLHERLRERFQGELLVEDLNLEEIFLELNR